MAIGLAFGIVMQYTLRILRRIGGTYDQQVGLTLAGAYLSYYTANAPCNFSGNFSTRSAFP